MRATLIPGAVPAAVFVQRSCMTSTSREFWTPWNICAATISDRLIVGTNYVLPEMAAELAPAVTSTTFQHLLTSTIENPCGEVHSPCARFTQHRSC
jgi:hypothetical protein